MVKLFYRGVKCGCGKISGAVNEIQSTWIRHQLKKLQSANPQPDPYPMTLEPQVVSFNSHPNWRKYTLRKVYIIHPSAQYKIPAETLSCPECRRSGTLRFKEFSAPRHVHCLTMDAYACSATYLCQTGVGGCGKTCSASNPSLQLFPAEIYLACPIVMLKRQAFSTELLNLAYDLICTKGSPSSVAEAIQRARTSHYITAKCLYYSHCRFV